MHKSQSSFKKQYFSRSTFTTIANISRLHYPILSINTKSTSVKLSGECILYPTYAIRDPTNSKFWIIRTKGWALSMKKAGTKQRVLKGITKSIAGKNSTNQASNKMFESRFKYFMAKGKRNSYFFIEAVGSTTNNEWDRNDNFQNKSICLSKDDTHLNPKDSNSSSWASRQDPSTKIQPAGLTPIARNMSPNTLKSIILPSEESGDSEDDENEDDDSDESEPFSPILPTEKRSNTPGVTLRSERTGLFSGQFHISDDQIRKWNPNISNKNKRIVNIKTEHLKNNKSNNSILATDGIVHLIEPRGVSIISDIDDTIKNTNVLAGARAVLRSTFFNPTRSIPGMADAYSHWYNLGASFHYVSNSPFQLFHVLFSFIRNHHFPPGTLHLRPSTGFISKIRASKRSKRDSICNIINDFPHRKFILVGDSGEIDLEIYTRIAMEFPGQILKIFIRDVTSTASSPKKSKERARQRKINSTFPSFFTTNTSAKNGSSLSLFPGNLTPDPSEDETEDDDETSDDNLDDATSKLAEMVLEPTLTGHGAFAISEQKDLPDYADPAIAHQPLSERLQQLHSRLELARHHLNNIDITLFKDAEELLNDKEMQKALLMHPNENVE